MRAVWIPVAVIALGAVLIAGVVAFPSGHRTVPFVVACVVFAIGSRLLLNRLRRRHR